LIDPQKRSEYDQFGSIGGQGSTPHQSSGTFPSFGRGHDDFFFKSPFDIFQEFFGGRDPFDDPFFRDPFGAGLGSSMSPHSAFDNDPFFSSFRHDPFFSSPMSRLTGHGMGSSNGFFQSSSSSIRGGNRITSQSKSTRTTIRNGQRETVTEIRDAQGNVRMEVQTEMPNGQIQNRLFLNGQEQPLNALESGTSGDGRRYRINIS
jgi:DnaJ-class molecular chaperone